MTVAINTLRSARTFLFVPGDRPERFGRALASSADIVIVDLEDAVAPEHKDEARDHAVRLLADTDGRVIVRINDPRSDAGRHDVAALATAGEPVAVMVPKADERSVLDALHARLPFESALLPLMETAAGILDSRTVAGAAGVVRLILGHLDLAADLGLAPDDHARLAPARFAVVATSAAATLPPPVDGVCTDVRDAAVVAADTVRGLGDGFTGKLCIHPAQIDAVHAALAPDAEDLSWAQRVLDAVSSEHSLAVVDGQLVDRPVIRRARAIVDRARTA